MSSGEQKTLWSSDSAGTGRKIEGVNQDADGQNLVIELRVGWDPECPEEVRMTGQSRTIIDLSESEEDEEEVKKATMEVMAIRDEKAKDLTSDFHLSRDVVGLYVA
jgi:hypothetical protein